MRKGPKLDLTVYRQHSTISIVSVYKLVVGAIGGGGGTSIYVHIWYVPLERPPFSALNFRSRASPFYRFCRSGDHHFQNFCTFKPFRCRPWLVFCSQTERKASGQRPGVTAGQSTSQTRPTNQLRMTRISRLSSLRSPPFFTVPWGVRAPPPGPIHFSTHKT